MVRTTTASRHHAHPRSEPSAHEPPSPALRGSSNTCFLSPADRRRQGQKRAGNEAKVRRRSRGFGEPPWRAAPGRRSGSGGTRLLAALVAFVAPWELSLSDIPVRRVRHHQVRHKRPNLPLGPDRVRLLPTSVDRSDQYSCTGVRRSDGWAKENKGGCDKSDISDGGQGRDLLALVRRR